MSHEIPCGRVLITANEAAAYAVMRSRAKIIGAYPITPQTLIVEKLAELCAGQTETVFTNLESEHSMLGFVIGASRCGVRVFTATSSQGLLYCHEQLHRASRERIPLVMVNVNRSLFAPWSLEPDLADSTSQSDTGWIQLYCSSVQEVFDTIVSAYRLAETVLLPVMVCSEGFILSHTSEAVDVPSQDNVDRFLPPFTPPADWVLDPTVPRAYSLVSEPKIYSRFQHNVTDAMEQAEVVLNGIARHFTATFGRPKVGTIEVSGNQMARTALVMLGTIGDTAKELLAVDRDMLIVRIHSFRPFPDKDLRRALANASRIAVIDRAPAFGSFGPLGRDVRAMRLKHPEAVFDFIAGVGGVDVTPHTLEFILEKTRSTNPVKSESPIHIPEEI